MTAPDKPLHDRIAEYLDGPAMLTSRGNDLLREAAAELSRMRAALEEIRAMHGQTLVDASEFGKRYDEGADDAFNQCAAIAERALTAGSGK